MAKCSQELLEEISSALQGAKVSLSPREFGEFISEVDAFLDALVDDLTEKEVAGE